MCLDNGAHVAALRALVLCTLLAAGAHAQGADSTLAHGAARFDFDWQAPAACPTRAQVQAWVADALSAHDQRPFLVRARVERLSTGAYRLSLSLRGGDYRAKRSIVANSCEQLAIAASWLIALAIDPEAKLPQSAPNAAGTTPATSAVAGASGEAAARGTQPGNTADRDKAASATQAADQTPKASVASTTSRLPAPTAPTADEPSAPTDSRWAPRMLAGGPFIGVSTLGLPAPQAQAGAALGLGLGALYLDAQLAGSLPRERTVAPPVEVEIWSLEGALTGCRVWGATLRIGACAGLGAIRSQARAENLSKHRDQAVTWAVARLELRIWLRLADNVEVVAGAGLGTPVSARPSFDVAGLGPGIVASRFNGYGRLGLGFRTR